ncbi:MAG: HAD family hydrolase [Phormidesmis sp.]
MAVWDSPFKTVAATQRIKPAQQVVFCDFDGPIVDVSERYYRTYRRGLLEIALIYRQETCIELTTTPLSKQEFWHLKQNRVADISIAMRSGVPEDWFERYMQQVENLVNHASLLRWDKTQPSAKAALMHLRQANMRLILVTLRHPRQVNAFLKSKGLAHLIDGIYGASSATAAHRNRVEQKLELLERAIAQQSNQGYRTQDSWMVGDTEADVLAAQAVGLPSAALACGVRSKDYLQTLEPTQIYDELLTAARAVVTTKQWQVA